MSRSQFHQQHAARAEAEARRLLAETDWRVNEIGARSGFADEKHFLKVFKAAAGVSPTEWRRTETHQHREPDAETPAQR